ncbi:hypothetical protein F5Y19DRAFT_490082 [Xylariaceae sp. FL1651]|nr:hypothetical protein F5Y19DRAFT_490082 [Xylariaceae sp. FL1651]
MSCYGPDLTTQAPPAFTSQKTQPPPTADSVPTTTAASPPPATSIAHNFLATPQIYDNEVFSDLVTSTSALEMFPSLVSPDNHDLDSLLSPLLSIPALESQGSDITLGDVLDFNNGLNNNNDDDDNGSSGDLPHNLEWSPEMMDGNFLGLVDNINLQHITYATETNANPLAKIPGTAEDQLTVHSDCDCLVQIMGLMKQLFPRPSPFAAFATTGAAITPAIPSVSAIIERNRSSMEAVRTALSCSCSDDPHMLAVIAHIVSKLLGWYVVAVQRAISAPSELLSTVNSKSEGGGTNGITSSADDSTGNSNRRPSSSTIISPPYSNHEPSHWETERTENDSGRMAAQLVLGELHLAQRLVTDLVSKLKSQPPLHGDSELAGLPLSKAAASLLLPLSGTVLDLLGNNLKDQLKTLSLGIIKRLRDD